MTIEPGKGLNLDPELIKQLVPGTLDRATINEQLAALKKAIFERALGGELTHHLGYEKGDAKPADIPDHDVLLAGFPCQPFSIAGVSKKNSLGRPHGFECTTQGTLFFDVARIIAHKRPKAFLLENVKNLLSHDKGNTFRVILETLRDELGYDVHYRVIDGQHFTPQHRERIIIVGFLEKTGFSWDDLKLPSEGPRLGSILHRTDGAEPLLPWDGDRFFDHERSSVQAKYTLTENLWKYLQAYAEKHRAAGNGFGFGMTYTDSVTSGHVPSVLLNKHHDFYQKIYKRAAANGYAVEGIHFTPVWNPALEAQASARAHRRGQTRPVTIYRLFYQDTVEQVMIERSAWKRELANESIPIATRDATDMKRALDMKPGKS
ncbi:DNA (cytosine-5-)-methyltransferase [Burkholderia cenocepacia]|uniref:DNA (cytosine-5-)-methyltransferase n=1 Tax=Burkholderia cenocepacia TaxID=95486 RepID=UPI0026505C59|nr:DNA (cytosine-5-)-methyltransferase [Burkholderia cenocepacia]MDN7684191.1 DNA (cytosine-5-)-methyltransferase [Burkholderia cenocepacia]